MAVKDSKKKKKQVMSLGQFQAGPGGTAARRRAVEDVRLSLPTAPRVREEGEEDTGPRLGGAFGQQYGAHDAAAMPATHHASTTPSRVFTPPTPPPLSRSRRHQV